MSRRMECLYVVALLACACASSEYPTRGKHGAHASADNLATAKLEQLKSLEGEWTIATAAEMPQGGTVNYSTVSGGSVVMEELFPGTPHSMVSMYHLEDGHLTMTHYCSLGNQPKMVAAPGGSPAKLRFSCVGGPSYDCKRDMHMHSAEFDFLPDGSVQARWASLEGGKPSHGATFDLKRKF